MNAAANAERAKVEEKIRRRAEREAQRKADELAKLKKTIEETFVDKAVSKDDILQQDLVEIDGLGKRGRATIGLLGGLLGQIMICYHTVAKHFAEFDEPRQPMNADGEPDESAAMERGVLNPASV